MSEILIKKAELSDFDFFYLIKCDEDNMYWSGHISPPIRDNLNAFFSSHIQNQDVLNKRTIFIVEKLDDTKVGYLYFDPIKNDSAEISIGIMQNFSGRGFGRQAVNELCNSAYKLGFKNIYAMVREDNIRSQKMFKHAGFKKSNTFKLKFIQNLNKKIKMIKFEKIMQR